MKNTVKIISVALLLVVLSLSLALSIGASEAPVIDIKGASFDEGTIRLYYAADSSAQSLKFYSIYPTADTAPTYETDSFETMTVEGREYKVFYSSPILIQDLRKPHYATVSSAEGVTSEVVKFSVFDYFISIANSGTRDQLDLFTALLDISAAMQVQLMETSLYSQSELDAIGGYSNEYCVAKIATYLDGAKVSERMESYRPGDTATVSADKALNGAAFVGFKDSENNPLLEYGELTAASWNRYQFEINKIGITEISLHYDSTVGETMSFDKYSSVERQGITKASGTKYSQPATTTLTADKNGVASSTKIASSAVASFVAQGANKVLDFRKVIAATEATQYADSSADKSGAYKVGDVVDSHSATNCAISIPNTASCEGASYYLFETDLYVYSTVNSAVSSITLLNDEGAELFGFDIKTSSGGKKFALSFDDNNETEVARQRIWCNLRVEYHLTDDTFKANIYLDGKLVKEIIGNTAASDSTFASVMIRHNDTVNHVILQLDNTLVTVVK